MGNTSLLTRAEIETLGPPIPEELADIGLPETCLHDLALNSLATLHEATSVTIAEKLHLPSALTEEVLYDLYRQKLIEMRLQSASGGTRYSILDQGLERVKTVESQCAYVGPAPVSLADYTHMTRLQAALSRPISMARVRSAFRDLVLPESLLDTLACAINSRSSLLLSGGAGTGKTAIAERMNGALSGFIWIPYAVEIDGQIMRVFDEQRHCPVPEKDPDMERDRRWLQIKRPLIIVGGEATIENSDLEWSSVLKYYEAPFQLKANGGTLVIDDFGRQAGDPQVLFNRWISPLERRVDFLTLRNGKKIEIPFEQLVVFSTNLEEKALGDEAFLRSIGYRANIEPPTASAFIEIFKRAATHRKVTLDQASLNYVLNKYDSERRPMKACEPRDLLNRVHDICRLKGRSLELAPDLLEQAWNNYFGITHSFESDGELPSMAEARSVAV
jgi:predicted ATPase with chaperone activity